MPPTVVAGSELDHPDRTTADDHPQPQEQEKRTDNKGDDVTRFHGVLQPEPLTSSTLARWVCPGGAL
ncbi:hypothetical protein GCM10027053_29100 [Intrasporangium mesophilum]